MKPYDSSKPITLENWPKGLKMPPLKRPASKPEKPTTPKPSTDTPERAPWWHAD